MQTTNAALDAKIRLTSKWLMSSSRRAVPVQELAQIIPDAQVLLAMEPEELGAKILFLLRKRAQPFLFSNLIGELWPQNYPHMGGRGEPYPQDKQEEINLAFSRGMGLAYGTGPARASTRTTWGTGLAGAQSQSGTF